MRSAVWTRYHQKQVAPCVEVGHTLDLGDLNGTSDSTGLQALNLNVELIESNVQTCV